MQHSLLAATHRLLTQGVQQAVLHRNVILDDVGAFEGSIDSAINDYSPHRVADSLLLTCTFVGQIDIDKSLSLTRSSLVLQRESI